MIYYAHVPANDVDGLYEFDGEHANCCSICKLHGNIFWDMNDLGVYYEPPLDCDEKDCCQRHYDLFVKSRRPCHSKWENR